jgi:cell division protein FtsB
MLEVSSRTSRKKNNRFFNKYIILSILCIAVLSAFPFIKSQISEYNTKNEELKQQIEVLKKQNEALKGKNDTLNKSKTDLDSKLQALPKSSQ